MKLLLGDCLEKLKDLEDNSVESVVTDPPYGLAFMGKKWDYNVPSIELWAEVFRVLKPGGHLLSFGGTRTYHRMVVNIEDAGFEIRDQIQWLYGSGFPKSHDVSKAIDKHFDAEREVIGIKSYGDGSKARKTSKYANTSYNASVTRGINNFITAPNTNQGKQWSGWGSALKPSNEPIVLARKPLEKGLTIAENVMKWGCGGINIDGSRIETTDKLRKLELNIERDLMGSLKWKDISGRKNATVEPGLGRWPANLILDETSAEMLGEVARFFYCAKASKSERNAGLEGMPLKPGGSNAKGYTADIARGVDRNRPVANYHPTVKPIKLMEYLIKLITPPGGICLDPFMGSGSTGVAAKKLGFDFIGIEREEEYMKIAEARINHAITQLEFEEED